jgi:hypothetical protein
MAAKKKPKFGVSGGLSHTTGGQAAIRNAFPKGTLPTSPPYGSYDPTLDQQERSANRGLGDLIEDVTRGNTRSGQDYELGKQGIERTAGRSLADLMNDRTRGTEDYGRQIQGLERDYTRLGNRQGQQNAASGNLGGAAAQGARKRAENMAYDRAPIDTSYTRFIDDSRTAETRLGEDKDLGLGELALGFSRDYEDRNLVQLPRAQRENTIFGQDVNETRIDQAKQSNLLPAGFGSQHSGIKPGPSKKRRKNTGYGRG